jgi:hypothetical protein
MQTHESLTKAAKAREKTNAVDAAELLAIAAEYQPSQPSLTEIQVLPTVSSTLETSPTEEAASPSSTLPTPPETPSPTTVSPTPTPPTQPAEETPPAAPLPPAIPLTPPQKLTTVTVAPGEKISQSIPAGVFIHKTTAKPVND